jgi:pSer/pThr/pTyr-binding forkhead associated (FHA) protein
MNLVIDYLTGARRGERQTLVVGERVSFGRHPDNMVAFDAQVDIDASSRHAEIVQEGDTYLLRDIGSSNGTWIGGEKVEERSLLPEVAAALGGSSQARMAEISSLVI